MNKNDTRQPCVYGLRAGSVYGYVGKTGVNSKTRLWEHRSRARSGHAAPVYAWMREVGIDAVEIVELDTDTSQEVFWITKLIEEGHPVSNQSSTDGIENSWSTGARRKVSALKSGKPTWIKGKSGDAAGWTAERRAAQSERIRKYNETR